MTDYHRIYGPPGTGKTTTIVALAKEYSQMFGRDLVTIVSLTNAAIQEVGGRIDFLDKKNVSTLHAQCKRSQGAGSPAESMSGQFVEAYPTYHSSRYIPLSMRGWSEDTPPEIFFAMGKEPSVYEKVNYLRHSLIPYERWTREQISFWKRWHDFQVQTGHPDYTGWLENALELRCLPAQQVVLVDEAQDHTPLELAVVNNWNAKTIYLVGDDDQNLYGFTGANAQSFYLPELPPGKETVLSQSWRVPGAVHRQSMALIRKIRGRKEKEYSPRDEEGFVKRSNYTLKDAENGDLPFNGDSEGKTLMILASCGYHLDPILKVLMEKRIPFGNPYRINNPKWNPLSASQPIMKDFIHPTRWSGLQAFSWGEALHSDKVYQRGRKKEFLDLCAHREKDLLYSEDLKKYFLEKPLQRLLNRDISLFKESSRLRSSSWEYGLEVMQKYGIDVKPQIILGTIHSVKGGESDQVYLAPDLSRAGMDEYEGQHRDRVTRLFYVGMTRAREGLVLLGSNQRRRVNW